MSILDARTHKLKYTDKSYTIPTKGLVVSWKQLNGPLMDLYFGTTKIDYPRENLREWNMTDLRKYLRDLLPQDEYTTSLCSLEARFFSDQLTCFEFYKSLTDEQLSNALFTRDIPQIYFKIASTASNITAPQELKIEEQYYNRTNEVEEIRLMT
jgi:hypothetical protein